VAAVSAPKAPSDTPRQSKGIARRGACRKEPRRADNARRELRHGSFPPPAIEVEALVKTYGEVEAVSGVSFTVARGEVFGFPGPNGAGKSTTINMLCTLARPTSGTARVSGFDVAGERDAVRRHIGLVFRLHAELYGIDAGVVAARMRQMLEMVDLCDRRHQQVRTYSGGMRRRLQIASGLMHSPPSA
jgi:ABC-2 type transport system ATP-binding protein